MSKHMLRTTKPDWRDRLVQTHELHQFLYGLVELRDIRGIAQRSGTLVRLTVTRQRLTIELTDVYLGGPRNFFGAPRAEGNFVHTYDLRGARLDRNVPYGQLIIEAADDQGRFTRIVFATVDRSHEYDCD